MTKRKSAAQESTEEHCSTCQYRIDVCGKQWVCGSGYSSAEPKPRNSTCDIGRWIPGPTFYRGWKNDKT